LRYALRHKPGGVAPLGTPATMIGQLCHRVTQRLIDERLIPGAQWLQRFDQLWEEETRALAVGPSDRVPELWPGYALKKVELRRALSELTRILTSDGVPDTIRTELALKSTSGYMRGRLDLLFRAAGKWHVVDLKTGRIDSGSELSLSSSYRRQVQLYAYLIAQQTGEWPSEAIVLPLEGAAVHVAIDPNACELIAGQAQALLDAYNSTSPATQPATVSSDTCPSCPVAALCPAFWSDWKAEYAPELIAYRGYVVAVYRAINGRTAVRVAVQGSDGLEIFIQGLDEVVHPGARNLELGDSLSAVGLKPAGAPGRFWLKPGGNLAITARR
jgi:CRISPR/Cas system-associated exonuclease Cas4 (RecB family)